MKFTKNFNTSSLSRRFIIYIVLFSSLFTLASSGLQLYTHYENDISDIEKEIYQIQQSYLNSLTNSLWQLDDSQINMQLQGILALPNVKHVEIIEEDTKTLYEKGEIPSDNFIFRSYEMVYDNGEQHPLGHLKVIFSLQEVYDNLEQQFCIILIGKAIQTFCVSLFTVFIFYRLIATHLHQMARYAQNLTLDKLNEPLILNKIDKNDELDQVAASINKMRLSMSNGKQKLQEQQNLQQQILALMPAAVFVTDASGIPTYVNQRAKEILGESAICTNSVFSELSAIYYAYVSGTNTLYPSDKQVIARALAGQKSYVDDMEIRSPCKNERIQIEAWGSPIFNPQNEVISAVAVFQDISERKQAEKNRIYLAQIHEAKEIAERLSITDELTQLYNRRYFNQVFSAEIQKATLAKQTISFLVFILDDFKIYNDNYGSQKGDDVLRVIAQILKASCRPVGDIPIRLGGKEFCVIFSGLSAQQAFEFADGIRMAIFDTNIEHNSNFHCVTASFGLVTCSSETQLDADAFYKHADEALHQAKDAGRNRVIQICV